MEAESRKSPRAESFVDSGEAVPLRRSPSGRRQTPQSDARHRRTMNHVVIACSSVVVVAAVGICYALLSP
jgi:hypothetical protein